MENNHIFDRDLLERLDKIIRLVDQGDSQEANRRWREVEKAVRAYNDPLIPAVLDIFTQLEFLMKDHPESDMSDLRHALYVAKVETNKR